MQYAENDFFMKNKLLLHFLLFAGAIFFLWMLLSRVDYRKTMRVDDRLEQIEEVLGKWSIRYFLHEYDQVEHQDIDAYIVELLGMFEESGSIQTTDLKVLVLRSEEVNAFALPGDQIVLFTSLIEFTESPEELLGVLAHELAHIKRGHVMQKLSREVGMAALFTLISGSYNLEALKGIAHVLTSTSYHRSYEFEADKDALHLMLTAGINPQAYIDFLMRMSEKEQSYPHLLQYISTHPHPDSRAGELNRLLDGKMLHEYRQPDKQRWNDFKALIKRHL